MEWTDLGRGLLRTTDEAGVWTIRPHGDSGWVNLVIEHTKTGHRTRQPEVDRRYLGATEDSVTVGFYASAPEAMLAYAIISNAPRLGMSGPAEALREWGFEPDVNLHPIMKSIIWRSLCSREVSDEMPAPDTFECYRMRNTPLMIMLDQTDQITLQAVWERTPGDYLTLSLMTAPDLHMADGNRVSLLGLDDAAVQVNAALQLLETRFRVHDDPLVPLEEGEEDELMGLIMERAAAFEAEDAETASPAHKP